MQVVSWYATKPTGESHPAIGTEGKGPTQTFLGDLEASELVSCQLLQFAQWFVW